MSHGEGLISESEVRAKTKGYIKIAVWLGILSLIEVFVPDMPVPKGWIHLTLVVMACWKAAMVGWYYMHLNHETKWLRWVALSPVIAAMYAEVLLLESPTRPASAYVEGRAREAFGANHGIEKIYDDYAPTSGHDEGHEKAAESEVKPAHE